MMSKEALDPAIESISADEMRQIDRWMTEEVGIDLLQMMENAGRALARLARGRFLERDCVGKAVAVLAGPGGNGGGAMAAARNLANWGAEVEVFLTREETALTAAALRQLRSLLRIGASVRSTADLDTAPPVRLVIEGLIGYSLRGPVRGQALEAITWANSQSAPVLSLDVPSGIDSTSGEVRGSAVRAAATLTLAFPKHGLLVAEARPYVGEIHLADIGVPPALFARLDPARDATGLFATGDIVRLT